MNTPVDVEKRGRRGPKPNLNTRTNLVQAGLQTFHREGFAATGIQSIVEQAGVPKGSFYNHFDSKETFGASVVDAYFERAQARLDSAFGNTELAPLARLETYFDSLIVAFRDNQFSKGCLMGNLSAEIADHSEAIRLRLVEQFAAWCQVIEHCLLDAQRQGQLDGNLSAKSLSDFILNSWEGALLRMRVEKNETPLQEFKQFIFGHLLG